MMANYLAVANGSAYPLDSAPVLGFDEFRQAVIRSISGNAKLACLASDRKYRAIAVVADIDSKTFKIFLSEFPKAYQTFVPHCPQTHLFEREIAEQWGIAPIGHPWFKPVRFHANWGSQEAGLFGPSAGPGVQDYYAIQGSQIHEVAVGPVHAGVIEPGHFRFQCDGEIVHHLEIALGYQHRGVERAMEMGPHALSLKMMETVSGDATIAHGAVYLTLLEALMGIKPTEHSCIIRALALELERLANHTGDLGALAQDVGYQPTAAYCGRLRGDLLNITAEICGNRLGRDLLALGGTRFDIHPALANSLQKRLADIEKDLFEAIDLLWDTSSVASRFEGTGIISKENALMLGMLGPAARASGIDIDSRRDFPLPPFDAIPMPIALEESGDVYARAKVRAAEIRASMRFAKSALQALQNMEPSPLTAFGAKAANNAPCSIAIAAVEGWRGMVFHLAITDEQGHFERYKIVDPSFFNWHGLSMAMRFEGISDFPLCNKSLNLSYCGFDL